jgi:D-threo-aldose 1-dehydrogenase
MGNLYREVSDEAAAATIDAAWVAGIRYFDTAPHYGLGLAERRLGAGLRDRPRAEFVLSTKVGRLLVDNVSDTMGDNPAGNLGDNLNQNLGESLGVPAGRDLPNGFDVPANLRRVWDFSADGVRRSLSESLRRLGLDRVDIALIHDPEESDNPESALEHAYPALHELRAQGVVDAIGVGSKQSQILTRFVTETDIDVVMLAGRYTLLEQPALDDILPACAARGVGVLNVGVFNSGILAIDWPDATAPYEYGTVPLPVLERAQRIARTCRQHGVSLPRAALAFAAAHPMVCSVVLGAGRPEHLARNAELLAQPPPPPELWRELVAEGLLRPDAPVPS